MNDAEVPGTEVLCVYEWGRRARQLRWLGLICLAGGRSLRCYLWKQWGRRGYRELKRQRVSVDLAWNTAKLAQGPWRLSQSPALTIALPAKYFRKLGLPSLGRRSQRPNQALQPDGRARRRTPVSLSDPGTDRGR